MPPKREIPDMKTLSATRGGGEHRGDLQRLAGRWLTFSEARPPRPRLMRKFIAAVVILLAVSALLAAFGR